MTQIPRQRAVDFADHRLQRVGPGNGQHLRVGLLNKLGIFSEATGDNHPAVFVNGFANRLQGFGFGFVDKSTGVDHHQVGVVVVIGGLVTIAAQLGDNAFRVHQRFGATEADEAYFS